MWTIEQAECSNPLEASGQGVEAFYDGELVNLGKRGY